MTLVVEPRRLGEDQVIVEGDDYRHLFRARRLDPGAELRLVDGRGMARRGRIKKIEPTRAIVAVGEPVEANESELRLEVWAGVPKGRRAAWLIEKSTEVGVYAVRWLDSERSGREVTTSTLDRQQRVARTAVEQCGRSRVPEITGPHGWGELLAALDAVEQAWILDPSASPILESAPVAGSGFLLVGPEGGWSELERSQLVDAGAIPLGLGARVLRVETAVVVGAARLYSALT